MTRLSAAVRFCMTACINSQQTSLEMLAAAGKRLLYKKAAPIHGQTPLRLGQALTLTYATACVPCAPVCLLLCPTHILVHPCLQGQVVCSRLQPQGAAAAALRGVRACAPTAALPQALPAAPPLQHPQQAAHAVGFAVLGSNHKDACYLVCQAKAFAVQLQCARYIAKHPPSFQLMPRHTPDIMPSAVMLQPQPLACRQAVVHI